MPAKPRRKQKYPDIATYVKESGFLLAWQFEIYGCHVVVVVNNTFTEITVYVISKYSSGPTLILAFIFLEDLN